MIGSAFLLATGSLERSFEYELLSLIHISFFGRWTEANPLCTGFWQVKQPRAILARSRGGLDGPPFFHRREG